jgi:hypothetical protein
VPLRITVDGVGEWTTDDYTLDEMVAVEQACKFKWSYVIASAKDEAETARALVVHWLARTAPDLEAAQKRAGSLTNRQVKVEQVEDDDRPIEWEDGLPVVDPKAATDGPVTT